VSVPPAEPAPSPVPEQAVILAAGEGRRLRPHTAFRPKPLMPFLNLPLLRHTLRLAARSGVRRVWINAWHLAQQVEDYVATCPEPSLEVTVVVEHELLGTAGGLANLWQRMDRAPVLLLLSDIVADFDLAALARQHRERGASATMALTAAADPDRYGAVHVDADHRLTDIAGLRGRRECADSTQGFVNASAHIFEPAFLDRLPREPSCFIRQGYVPALEDGMACMGWLHEGGWFDTGTPAALLEAQAAALSGALHVDDALLALGGRRHGTRGFVHASSDVAEGVRLEGGSTVAQGCVIGPRVRLTRCLVMPDTHIAADTVAEGAILGGLPAPEPELEVSA
jgi:mannose-1-phosphate guanylyltransferase